MIVKFSKLKVCLWNSYLMGNLERIVYVTFHGKTYTNAFPLNALKLTPSEWRANDFWERLNDLVNALNGQVKISNGFRKRSNN